ncbi:MAG: hypothetical protein R6X14_09915 [bacterium]
MTKVSLVVLSGSFCLLLLANAGCMKCGETIAERAVETAIERTTGVQADLDRTGTVDVSDLPGFLGYPGAKAMARFGGTQDGATVTNYAFECSAATSEVISWYKSSLSGQGWKEIAHVNMGDGTMMVNYARADEKANVSVVVGTDDGKTTIAIVYGTGVGN